MNTSFQRTQPTTLELFSSLVLIGFQSFGGGQSTLGLIHQLVVPRNWLSEEEFTQTWALVQLAPGINLLKLVILIGYRLQGWVGGLAASSALIIPSATVTVLMTAGFASVRELPWIQAMMKGILPAVIGVSLATGIQMAHPMLTRAQREGAARLAAHLFILSVSALLIGAAILSPVIILFSAGIVAAVLFHFTAHDQPVSMNDKDSA